MAAKKTVTLEQAFEKLDQIIEALENREITLEDSFAGYQEGMKLIKLCSDQIDTVEKKMILLNENGEKNEV